MIPDTRWQQAMIAGLGLNPLFSAAQLAIPEPRARDAIRPTTTEVDRAVASIHTWRSYLPPSCVTAMIKDGWHWST